MGQNFKKNLGLLRLLPALLLRRHPLHPQEAAQQVHSGHQKGGHRQPNSIRMKLTRARRKLMVIMKRSKKDDKT